MPKLIALLESYEYAIFHRLALDLLQRFPRGHEQLIAERLTTEKLFEDLHYRREYLKDAMGELYIVQRWRAFDDLDDDEYYEVLRRVFPPRDEEIAACGGESRS